MEEDTKSKYVIFVSVAVVALIIGVGAGFFAGINNGVTENKCPQISSNTPFPMPSDIRTVTGTVKSISGNTLVLSVLPQTMGSNIAERTVSIDSSTKVVQEIQKTSAVFQKEVNAFMKKMNAGDSNGSSPTPPTPFIEKTASMSDLTAGMNVVVSTNENVKNKASFVATKISIVDTASLPIVNSPEVQ